MINMKKFLLAPVWSQLPRNFDSRYLKGDLLLVQTPCVVKNVSCWLVFPKVDPLIYQNH